MGILFPRLANSHAKNGYYPTDDVTVEAISTYIKPLINQTTICDPCAGEGYALAELKHVLSIDSGANVKSFGVEYDKERAYGAKQILDTCIHADIQDCLVKSNQFGLLFLNPPYGDLVSDNLSNSSPGERQRLEKLFFEQTASSLVFGGLLILIIPDYCLDDSFTKKISRRFTNVCAFKAADPTYKQIVIMGQRTRVNLNKSEKETETMLNNYRENGFPEISSLDEGIYEIPFASCDNPVIYNKVDLDQLQEELKQFEGLWPSFNRFNNNELAHRRPLFHLSDWHLALSLASGLVSGLVQSNDGKRKVLVKGATVKQKKTTEQVTVDDAGNTSETITKTDVFVPTIRAIELTEGDSLGQIFNIR